MHPAAEGETTEDEEDKRRSIFFIKSHSKKTFLRQRIGFRTGKGLQQAAAVSCFLYLYLCFCFFILLLFLSCYCCRLLW